MPCWATEGGQVIAKNSDKTWSTGGGNGNPLQISCHEKPMKSMKKQKGMTPEDASRSESIWYATGEERKKEREVTLSCLTLCDPVDCSPPGSSVHGILQARILEWVVISFSRGYSQPRDRILPALQADALSSEPPGKPYWGRRKGNY